MKLLILAGVEPERSELASAAGEFCDTPIVVSAWDTFMREFVATRPDCAVLSLETLLIAGSATIRAAEITLKALGVPVVVSSGLGSADPACVSLTAQFPFAIEPPVSVDAFAQGVLGALRARQERVSANRAAVRSRSGDSPAVPTAPHPSDAPALGAGIAAERRDATGGFFQPVGLPTRSTQTTVSAPTVSEVAARAFEDAPVSDLIETLLGEEVFAGEARRTPRGTPVVPEDAVDPSLDDDALSVDSLVHSAPLRGISSELRALSGGAPVSRGSEVYTAALTPTDSGSYRLHPSGASPVAVALDPPSAVAPATAAVGEPSAAAHTVAESAGPVAVDGYTEETTGEAHAGAADPEPESAAASDTRAAPGSTPEAVQIVEVPLPDPNAGQLSAFVVPQLFYALSLLRATGELTLANATLERRVIFFDGEPGMVFQAPSAEDEGRVLGTFGWTSGTYRFERKAVPEAQFFTFGEPIEFVHRGFVRHVGVNESAASLTPHMRRYVAATDLRSRFGRVLGLERVADFVGSVGGTRTLEELISTAGPDIEATLRSALFARLVGAVAFFDAPATRPVQADVSVAALRGALSGVVTRVRGASGNHSASGSSGSSASRPVSDAPPAVERRSPPAPAPAAAQGSASVHTVAAARAPSSDHRETFERLRETWSRVEQTDGYEVFGLQAGCGPDEVSKRFYELVREYHPDRYAQAGHPQIKQLAEKIFVHVRTLHSDLLARERSLDAVGSTPATASTLTDSGIQRRRMRAGASRTANSGANRAVASPAPAPSAGSKSVGDALERLRGRAAEGPALPVAGGNTHPTGGLASGAASSATAARRLNTEQLLRNVKSSVEQGNFAKATEMLDMARGRGGSGPMFEAYERFLRYANREVRAADAIEVLEKTAPAVDDSIDRSWVLTLVGHVCRLEELNRQAVEFYDRAVKLWPDNESASRWARHLRKRALDDEKRAPFSSSFLNKLFTPKPAK